MQEYEERLSKAYGKVSQEEYAQLLQERPADKKPRLDEDRDLREDYELGVVDGDGEFFVAYRCECQACGYNFRFAFTHHYKSGKATLKYGDLPLKRMKIDEVFEFDE